MNLEDAYKVIGSTLRPQVQGTCGLYSFYNGVQIMRVINNKLPTVPAPKKSEAPKGAGVSLREYAKREFKSGQGEILTAAEMTAFVKAWGYGALSCTGDSTASEKDFMTIQTRAGHPVLIAYLADQDSTGIIPVPNAASGDPGAHWSLVIGTKDADVKVVEPNAPGSLKNWAATGLLQANAAADVKKFERYWAKEEMEYFKVTSPTKPLSLPKVNTRGINPVKDPSAWTANTKVEKDGLLVKTSQTKLYDLGGDSGTRHIRQKLSHVLIAILPPD